jgi:hypothetical protein
MKRMHKKNMKKHIHREKLERRKDRKEKKNYPNGEKR